MKKESAKDKLIVALDVDSQLRALDLFERLREHAGMFKVGLQLFTAAGPDIVRKIVARGSRVFLDLKYHDIPNTVAMAAIEACGLDGVVASAQEATNIRNTVSRSGFLIVTPGIRSAASADDQRRTMTIAEAIRAGADYLVVGRPILRANDPVTAARRVVEEIESALA